MKLPNPAGPPPRGVAPARPPAGRPGTAGRLLIVGTLVGSAGCASSIDVRAVGTADPALAAFDLRGPSLPQLHVEAARLCPRGAEVLRQWQRFAKAESDPSRAGFWFAAPTTAWVDAVDNSAQLLVACKG